MRRIQLLILLPLILCLIKKSIFLTRKTFPGPLIKSFILINLFLFMIAGSAFAYRPLQTEDAQVAGKGVFQSELSWDYLKWKNGDVDNVFLLVSPIFGPAETLELSAEIPYVYHKPKDKKSVNGISDINLVAKQVLIMESGNMPQITVKGVIKLDNGNADKGLGTGGIDYSLFAVATKSVGPFAFHAHLGHTWIGNKEDGSLRNIALWGLAADYGATDLIHVVAEIYGNRNPDKRLADLNNVLVGATYRVSGRVVVDASLRRGLNSASLSWGGGVGIAYQFN